MAKLTEDRKTERKQGLLFALPAASASHIFAGAMVCVSGGYLFPAADVPNCKFIGVAKKEADNTDGENGDVICEGYLRGVFQMNAVDVRISDLLKDAYIVDDNTVTTRPGHVKVGRIIEVISSRCVFIELIPGR